MAGTRQKISFISIILVITAVACGCNLSSLNPTDLIADMLAKTLFGDAFAGQTGYQRYETLGMAFTVPEGYNAFVSGLGGGITPEGETDFPQPIISLTPLDYDYAAGKDYDYWEESEANGIRSGMNAEISEDYDLELAGREAHRWDYQAVFTNYENEEQTALEYGVTLTVDIPGGTLLIIDANWPVEMDAEVRPIFEQWLSTIEFFEPVIPTIEAGG